MIPLKFYPVTPIKKPMFLSDNEKRDITKHLEADKPLPEKYRFLLFEDKREVELVWNGKTSEAINVVLPLQINEQVDIGVQGLTLFFVLLSAGGRAI